MAEDEAWRFELKDDGKSNFDPNSVKKSNKSSKPPKTANDDNNNNNTNHTTTTANSTEDADGLSGAFSLETALKRDEYHDVLYKIIIIGAAGVGKTNLLGRWMDNKFAQTSATLNVELATKSFDVDGKIVKVQLWDTAGQEQYRSITKSYYRKSHGAIVAYDVTRRDSFAKLDEWVHAVREVAGNENTQLLLVGNKCDLVDEREVSTEEGIKFAREHSINFLETSALNGTNVHRAFQIVLQDIHKLAQKYAKLDEQRLKQSASSKQTVKLVSDEKKDASTSGCCDWL